MTPKQRYCLDFIREYWTLNGYAPSFDDIREAIGASSKSSVASMVAALERRGFISRVPRSARSIRVIAVPEYGDTPEPLAPE